MNVGYLGNEKSLFVATTKPVAEDRFLFIEPSALLNKLGGGGKNFEKKPYDRGTNKLANLINSKKTLISIAGGGDTIAAIKKNKKIQNFSYLSTGGGAFLHWLEKFTLPGIEALKK